MQHDGRIVELRLSMSDEIIHEAVSRPTCSDPSVGISFLLQYGLGLAHTLKDVTKPE